jgi:hypothetical protein
MAEFVRAWVTCHGIGVGDVVKITQETGFLGSDPILPRTDMIRGAPRMADYNGVEVSLWD